MNEEEKEIDEEKENVRFFKEGEEEYAAIIVPRDVCEYFIHYKNLMEEEIDVKYESVGHYLFAIHESTLEPDEKVEKKN
ncbi:hypothetical protein KAW18_02345 [candidate division WOR-3 bacterium]|nr:hypothetical protein [candidate division WOR-3 bacterium]